jgi:hypothetical protein
MLLVSATAGVVGMTQEHLGIAVALEVPFFVVVTKVSVLPPPPPPRLPSNKKREPRMKIFYRLESTLLPQRTT